LYTKLTEAPTATREKIKKQRILLIIYFCPLNKSTSCHHVISLEQIVSILTLINRKDQRTRKRGGNRGKVGGGGVDI